MSKDPAIQFYCNDWLSSPTVLAMEPLQELAYFRMLLFMWQSGDCSIPNDAEKMGRLTRTDANTCSIVFEQAMNTHPECSSKLTNDRLYGLWQERQEYREKKRKAGQKSGQKRRNSKQAKQNEQTRTPVQLCSNKTRTNANSSSSSSSSSSLLTSPRARQNPDILIPASVNTPAIAEAFELWATSREETPEPLQRNSPQEQVVWQQIAGWKADPELVVLALQQAAAGQYKTLRSPQQLKIYAAKESYNGASTGEQKREQANASAFSRLRARAAAQRGESSGGADASIGAIVLDEAAGDAHRSSG